MLTDGMYRNVIGRYSFSQIEIEKHFWKLFLEVRYFSFDTHIDQTKRNANFP